MEIKINIEKKHLYFLIGLVIVLGALVVVGYGGNQPSVMGHSGDEIKVNVGGQSKSLNAALNDIVASAVKYKVGRYTGDGSYGRIISGIGFAPKAVIVMPLYEADGCDEWVIRTNDISETTSPDTQGQQQVTIMSLENDGFKISSNCNVNSIAIKYSYVAWTW